METITIEKPAVQTKEALSSEVTVENKQSEAVDPALEKQADEILSRLLSVGEKDLSQKEKLSKSISSIGYPIQEKLAKQSQMLKAPMSTLVQDAQDGGQVARSLLSLQENVNEINPNKVDFTMSTVRRLLAKLPGFGTPLSRWFAKYQAVDAVINDIVGRLKDGKGQLERDNTTLQSDQKRMRELIFQLQDYISLAQVLDAKLSKVVEDASLDAEKLKFLQEEILFPLKQRIIDLQQQLAVNQQGVLATEVIIRNNIELIKGVNRSLNVTVTALNTAATLQVALQHQVKVLKGVEACSSKPLMILKKHWMISATSVVMLCRKWPSPLWKWVKLPTTWKIKLPSTKKVIKLARKIFLRLQTSKKNEFKKARSARRSEPPVFQVKTSAALLIKTRKWHHWISETAP